MAEFDPTKTPGAFGAPPPEAPREIAQPLTEESLSAALEKARANEQPLAPFNPEKRMGVAPPQTIHAAPKDRPQGVQPAASNTDSPSRGVPREILDPGKRITGGFGHAGEAQYFPLDGSEAREMAYKLMEQMGARLLDDLRFHVAICYPRIRIRLVLEVEAYADAGFEVEQIAEHSKTPIAVARKYADKVAFALIEQRQEMDNEGNAENPPDRMRDELGLEKPKKQQIQTAGGPQFVDVKPSLNGVF